MRVKEKIENIDYNETKQFFKNRAGKFRTDNPYAVTMYQDHNEKLVRERNEKEVQKLKPLLELNEQSRILDIGCGIGRWGDAISEKIEEYCGLDFSSDLIKIAKSRSGKSNYFFYESAVTEIERVLSENKKQNYNTILLMGILMYINDEDMDIFLEQLEHQCMEQTRICIREPIGVGERLTLKDFFSEDLNDNYKQFIGQETNWFISLKKNYCRKVFRLSKKVFCFRKRG